MVQTLPYSIRKLIKQMERFGEKIERKKNDLKIL